LLVQEKESNQELKKLLKLENEKNEKLDQKLAQSKDTISSLKSSSGGLQDWYDVLQKTHKDLEIQFDALWSSTTSLQTTMKLPQVKWVWKLVMRKLLKRMINWS
jgi:small-conductance mechanosensitive channel